MNENNEKFDIQIEVRTIEIPASEYRRLIAAETMLDAIRQIIRDDALYGNDIEKFTKALLKSLDNQCPCRKEG